MRPSEKRWAAIRKAAAIIKLVEGENAWADEYELRSYVNDLVDMILEDEA